MNYEALSDIDLVQRYCIIPPDEAAFGELWRRHEPTARKYAYHLAFMCPHFYSRELFAEDVFSKTQEKVVKKISTYEGRATFSTWLWSISQRTAIEIRRKLRTRGPAPVEIIPVTEKELTQAYAVFRDKLKDDPYRKILIRERNIVLQDVLRRYATTQEGYESLRAVMLQAVDHCKVSDIAKLLGTYERKIYRMFDHDYSKIRSSLVEAGIEDLLEI